MLSEKHIMYSQINILKMVFRLSSNIDLRKKTCKGKICVFLYPDNQDIIK